MARTYVKPGAILTLIAPSGGVVAGTVYQIGAFIVVAQNTAAQTEEFEGMVEGVHNLAKTSAQAWTVGQLLYFNTSTKKIDSDGSTGPLVGAATAIAANPSSTGQVRLNGRVTSLAEGPQPLIAALVDNSGGAAADGTIAAVTDSATSANAVKELATQVNAILAALKVAGIIAAA